MFEDNFDTKGYIKCIVQVLMIDFGFSQSDILELCSNVNELYYTSLQEYLENRN